MCGVSERMISQSSAKLIADAVVDCADAAHRWKERAVEAEKSLAAIRAMVAGYAGQPSLLGDVFKLADAPIPTDTEEREEA